MKRLFLSLFLILGTFSASFAASNATDIYLLAQTKSTSELGKVEDIDAVDADGNTALCSAIKDNNIDAYNLLKKAGANTEHKCVKKIPAKQYQAFTQKLATTSKPWSFLGMGKWAWTAIGVGVAGGAAAAGMGGGGASGGDGSGDNPLSHYTPHFNEWLQQGFQYEPCQDGYYATDSAWDWAGVPGDSEKVWMYKCAPNYCSYTTTECTAGYVETGNTCKSGETLYKECIPNSCDGYDYMSFSSCPEGWTTGSSCLSGTTMKYKCDSPQPCLGYEYTDSSQCPAGYTTGSSCLSGSTTKYKCDQYTLCDYTTTECTGGYVETGNTCQSGETLYKECTPRTCSYNTISCAAGYHETGNTCQSGETTYVECEINTCEGYDYTADDTCPNGWTMYSSCLSGTTMKYMCDAPAMCPYDTTTCTTGYHETGATCQSGDVLYKECEADACDGYNYTNAEDCPLGYTVSDSCLSGSVTKYKCETPVTCPYNTTECPVGYVETGDTCQSGETTYVECTFDTEHYIEQNGIVYLKLDCQNGSTQNGETCTCQNGWTGTLCDTPITCPYNTTSCVGGYAATGNSCQSGNVLYVECSMITCEEVTETWTPAGCVCSAGYGRNSSGVCEALGADKIGRIITNNDYANVYGVQNSNNNGYISLENNGDGNVIGLNNATTSDKYNTYLMPSSSTDTFTQKSTIEIINNGDGTIIGGNGIDANSYVQNRSCTTPAGGTHSSNYDATGNGTINIKNIGNGDVYGMIGYENAIAIDGLSTDGNTYSHGYITIQNTGNGNVYGLKRTDSNTTTDLYNARTLPRRHIVSSHGNIKIRNVGTGTSYGMYSDKGNIYNSYLDSSVAFCSATGTIKMLNMGNGDAYGMYNSSTSTSVTTKNGNNDTITINNTGSGTAIGIYANAGTISKRGTITLNNFDVNGTIIGISGGNTIENSGSIILKSETFIDDNFTTNTTDDITYTVPTNHGGTGIGMYVPAGATATNYGSISIDGLTNGYGIYAKQGATITNSGTITITNTTNAYGIYGERATTVYNTGTIKINNYQCTGTSCGSSHNAIVLNGSVLYNSGQMMASQMNLNSFGGNVVAGLGSQFVIDNELSGDLNISSELVQSGNQTTYIAENMIDAGDISGLNVRSASAMFDASVAENGHDVVMQMKDFGDLTDNKSLAAFLANNYAKGKGQDLFSTLKSMDNMSAFNSTLSGLTGLNTFTQFAHEDLSAMREISFSMNNKLFENSSRDSFDISDSTGYFSFSNDHNGGSGRYGISSDKISDNWKLGYGMAMANINTGNGDNMHRQNNLWLFYMPATYTNNDIELVIASKAGFAHSEYNRRGYNNINYEGYIEKRIFGLMNDLRYPVTFGNWTFAPDLAFNTIVYEQSGREDEQAFSLIIPDDRTISVETGLGFYTKYEKQLSNSGKFKLNSGLMLYREFGDTYDIKLGMRGMDGTFSLYNNDYEYRGAASLGFDYTTGHLHLYGNAQYFMDNANYMNFKGGVSYRF